MRSLLLVIVATAGCDPSPSPPRTLPWMARAVSAAENHTLVATTAGAVETEGASILLPTTDQGDPVELTLPSVLDVAVGHTHACALATNSTVHCWGDQTNGALGAQRVCTPGMDGGPPDCTLNAEVMPTLPPIRELAAGTDVTCAITLDDQVYCWGAAGPWLGGSTVPLLADPTPIVVDGAPLLVARVLIHDTTVCAIDRAAAAWCWGTDYDGTPLRQPFEGVVDLAFNARHACAITADGLTCWGENRNGESGDLEAARTCGDDCRVGPTPIDLAATRVVVGERHACALTATGEVWCWGSNEVGQLGRDDAFLVGGLGLAVGNAIDLVAGDAHTCALGVTGSVTCWGEHLAIAPR